MKKLINYAHFSELDIRVAKISAVEAIEGADRLWKLTLDVGEVEVGGLGQRTVAAGIKQYYSADDLLGKLVVYLANLEPKTLRGVESQGMILAADTTDGAVLLEVSKTAKPGSVIR